jgi:Fe-S cluster assembly iron-binding protein IscA
VRAFDHDSTTYQDAFISIENKLAPQSPSFQSEVGTSGALDVELPSNAPTTAQDLVNTINGATLTPEHLNHWTAELTTDSDNPDGISNDGSGVMPGARYQHAHTVQSVPIRAGQSGFFGGTTYDRYFRDFNALRAFPTDDSSAGVSAIEFDSPKVAYRVWPTLSATLNTGKWSWIPAPSLIEGYYVTSPAGRPDDQRDLIGERGTDDSQKWLPIEDATFEAMTEAQRDTYVEDSAAGGDRIQNAGALMYAKLPQSAHAGFSSAVKTDEGVAGNSYAAFSSTAHALQLLGDQSMILRQTSGGSESERYFFGVNVANSAGTQYAYDLNYTPASYNVDPHGEDNAFVIVIDDASVDTTLPLRIEYAHKTAGNAITAVFTPDDGGVNRLKLEFSRRGDTVDEIVPVVHDLAAFDAYLADGSTGTGKIGFRQNINGTYAPSNITLQLPSQNGQIDVTIEGTGTATVVLDGSLATGDPQLTPQGGASNHVLRYQPNSALAGFVSTLEAASNWSTLSNVTVTAPSASDGVAVTSDAETTLQGGADFDADQTSLVLESGTLEARSNITVTGKTLRVEVGSAAAVANDADGIVMTVVPGDTTVNDLKALASFDASLESLVLTSASGVNNDAALVVR